MKKLLTFVKTEPVLSASAALALISCFLVPPDRGYVSYINYDTVLILFCLMVVVFVFAVVVIVMVMVTFAVGIVAFVIVVIVGGFGGELGKHFRHGVALFHRREDIFARQGVPIGGDDRRRRVVFAQQGDKLIDFLLAQSCGVAQDQGGGVFDLIVEKLAEVFHIHFAFFGVHHVGDEHVV